MSVDSRGIGVLRVIDSWVCDVLHGQRKSHSEFISMPQNPHLAVACSDRVFSMDSLVDRAF